MNAQIAHISDRRFEAMLIMVGAMLAVPLMDVAGKYLSLVEGVSPATTTFFRFLVQGVVSAGLIVVMHGFSGLRTNQLAANLLRGVLLAVASGVFLISVKFMAIADALAIFFIEPFILTAMSAIFLREKVGWRRWLAIAVGFCGALVVIRPNFAEIGAVSLLPLVTATTFAIYLMLNRVLAARDTSLVMQYTAGMGACAMTLAVFAVSGYTEIAEFRWTLPTTPLAITLIGAVGLVSTFGHLAIVSAFRLAPASLLAPFQYFEIVSGAVFGYIVFAEFPDLGKWIGFAIIIASGLYLLHRERQATWPEQ